MTRDSEAAARQFSRPTGEAIVTLLEKARPAALQIAPVGGDAWKRIIVWHCSFPAHLPVGPGIAAPLQSLISRLIHSGIQK